jgi:hypothetical protein
VRAAAGTVRVIAIDNAGGALEGGPDGAQAAWLREVMEQARGLGYASIAIGSMPLDASQQAKPAADAAAEIALLAGHASAYVATAGVDDPLDQHFGGTLTQSLAPTPGGSPPLPVLQSSTLGYAPSQALLFGERPTEESFNRQTAAALMLLDVAVDQLDRQTGLAPVSIMSEPLLDGLSLDGGSTAVPLGWAQQLFASATSSSSERTSRRARPVRNASSACRSTSAGCGRRPARRRSRPTSRSRPPIRMWGASSPLARLRPVATGALRSCWMPRATSSTTRAASSARSALGRRTSR